MRLTSFSLRLHTVSQRKSVQPSSHVNQAIQNVKYCVFDGLKLEGERRADSIEGRFMFMSVVQSCCARLGPEPPSCLGSMQRYVYDQLNGT